MEAAQRLLAEPPPVDPAIPLKGFSWDGTARLYVDAATGYTFEPLSEVFLNTRTRREYVYDKRAELFRPRADAERGASEQLVELFGAQLS